MTADRQMIWCAIPSARRLLSRVRTNSRFAPRPGSTSIWTSSTTIVPTWRNDGVGGGQRESDGEGLLVACPRAADPRSVRMPVTTRRHVGLSAVIVVVAA